MSEWVPRANNIFLEAISIESVMERERHVAEACGPDQALRIEVDGLLDAHRKAGNFLERPLVDAKQTTPFVSMAEDFGSIVGPYKLGERIGEGGMGVVFVAEQQHPVKRSVAFKIIRPGMGTKEVIARFEAERQALALMDHPNIARVLDAGSTEEGHPYFVMELVDGIPITEYCDQNDLSTRERLGLFVVVCSAVQHAHQKGIIHRDIKPSNVLVAQKDGELVPKVIDFGVAKALNPELTGQTLRTCFAQMIGTPLYMSPEQAALSGMDVDTRSDVYSLGVLLYELLTGRTPFPKDRLEAANYSEFRRIVCEEEPPKPSVRISTVAADHSTVAEQRKIEPLKSGYQLRGELDWIVMRALDKDRGLRYQSARSFAADVQRYLNDEPVEACPPSIAYRMRKFVRRHRAWLTTAAIVLIVLLAASSVSIWQAIRAYEAEKLAQARLEEVSQAQAQAHRNRSAAMVISGSFYAAVKEYGMAEKCFCEALELDSKNVLARNNYAWFLVTCPEENYRDPHRAVKLATEAANAVPEQGTFWNTLGVAFYRNEQWEEAIDVLEKSDQLLGKGGFGFNGYFLAMSHWQLGHQDQAADILQKSIDWAERTKPDDEELKRFRNEAERLMELVQSI